MMQEQQLKDSKCEKNCQSREGLAIKEQRKRHNYGERQMTKASWHPGTRPGRKFLEGHVEMECQNYSC